MGLRVIGIDPGSRITGFGVVERQGNRLVHIASGAIEAHKRAAPFDARLEIIYHDLHAAFVAHKPDIAVLENIFHYRNAQSALKLGHARGVAMLVARLNKTEVVEYQPAKVKQAVVGNGGANKEQVRRMVSLLLGIPATTRFDESDALANAICHLNAAPTLARLKQAS